MSFSFQNNIPLSLYVHIPWCVKKCPYCDFNSHEKNHTFDEQAYIDALLLDLENEYKICRQRELGSIFFGGGTPSLFSAESIQKIIARARQLFKADAIEITLEANPGTLEREKFDAFHNAGINRLSIGVQSFNDVHLNELGRIHDKQQAFDAIETAKAVGFNNINLDLMFGLPQQTTKQAVNDITIACDFDVPHISHYQLTIEENTCFHKYQPVLPVSDAIWQMQTHCQKLLAEKNYQQYEVSAYARTGKQCKHNRNYWLFGDYIGIGAGAHGKLTEQIDETGAVRIVRRWKYRQPRQYIQQTADGNALSGQQVLAQQDIIFEFLLNALRLKTGCDIATFEQRTGKTYRQLREALINVDTGLLAVDKNRVAASDKGFLFLNTVLENLSGES